MGTLSSIIGGASLLASPLIAQQQYKLNRKQWLEQAAYNSPRAQIDRLKAAGINPNRVLAGGQIENSIGEQQPVDLPASMDSVFGSAQKIADIALQSKRQKAEIDRMEEDTKKIRSERELNEEDIKFRSMLNQGNLDLLDSQIQKNLASKNVDDQTVKNLSAQYDNLLKEGDQILANIDSIKANADKMREETAMIQLQESLQQKLADAQIEVSKSQCYLMAKQAYAAAMSGDASKIQANILSVQRKYADDLENSKLQGVRQDARQKSLLGDYQEKANKIISNEAQVSDAGVHARKSLAVASAWINTIGQVFMHSETMAAKTIGSALPALLPN